MRRRVTTRTPGKQEKYLFPVVANAPFYAQRMGIGLMLTTMGGLCSDEHAHVLTPDYQVIPGLYACGNIQGDRFAVKYPFKLSGASHAMAVYYGNVAGNTAASNDAANYRAKVYQAASAKDRRRLRRGGQPHRRHLRGIRQGHRRRRAAEGNR